MSASLSSNKFGPSVGSTPAQPPTYDINLVGQYTTIVAVHPDHADALYAQISGIDRAHLFDYLFDYPPASAASWRATLAEKAATTNPWTYTILLNPSSPGEDPIPVGLAALMRMDLPNRVIEIGSLLYSPKLQRTRAATEAQYLLASYVFDTLHFRRYEWKCNSLNEPSMRAAARLGFTYEGTFRQHMVQKGRNRDTAWFSVVDGEWQGIKKGMEGWLSRDNFDDEGRQRRRLEEFRGEVQEFD
ncbi:hypothetical protein ACN47E_005188 [Coniothyrium glycines]